MALAKEGFHMSDFYQRIVDEHGGLEDLVRQIPGFKGYFEREDRREADRLLRDHIVRVFEERLVEFTQIQKRLVDAGGLMYMERVQGITTNLQTFIDRVNTAARGYAGVFDAIKVKEEELAQLYAFDNALLAYADRLGELLTSFGQAIDANEGVEGAIRTLEDFATEVNNVFKRRVEVIQNLAV
jgi:hypothetical protein